MLPLTPTEVPDRAEFERARVDSGQSTLSSERAVVPDQLTDQAKDQRVARGQIRAGTRGVDGNAVPDTEQLLKEGAVSTLGVSGEPERFGDLAELAVDPPGRQDAAGFYENARVDAVGGLESSSETEGGDRENVEVDEVGTFRTDDVGARDRDAVDRKMVGGVAGTTSPSAGPIDVSAVRIGGNTGIEPPDRIEYVAPDIARNASAQGVVLLEVRIAADGEVTDVRVVQSIPTLDAAAIEAVERWKYAPPIVNGAAGRVVMTVPDSFPAQGNPDVHAHPGDSQERGTVAARHFLEERARVEGLYFQPARGYWANTYVPGDPVLRGLRSTLAAHGSHDASGRVNDFETT